MFSLLRQTLQERITALCIPHNVLEMMNLCTIFSARVKRLEFPCRRYSLKTRIIELSKLSTRWEALNSCKMGVVESKC